jgi:hypothetical protein
METRTAEFKQELKAVQGLRTTTVYETLAHIVEVVRQADRHSDYKDALEQIEDTLDVAGLDISQYEELDSEREEED